jgi:hypothetical protein
MGILFPHRPCQINEVSFFFTQLVVVVVEIKILRLSEIVC